MSPLVRTIIAVEMMDIMFSVDSIGAAFGVSEETWVLVLGGIIGIAMMRFASGIFIKLIARFPILEKVAFVLVGIAGGNLFFKAFGR